MKICLYANPAHARQWLQTFADRLTRDLSADVVILWSDDKPLPDHILQHLQTEKRRLHHGQRLESDPIDVDDLSVDSFDVSTEHSARVRLAFDLVLDLVGDGYEPVGNDVIKIVYDGNPGDRALIAAILQYGLPQIALVKTDGTVVATAHPSAELAVGLSGAMEQCFIRLCTLIRAYIANPHRTTHALITRQAEMPTARQMRVRLLKSRMRGALKSIYYKLFRAGHWRIGWRWLDEEGVVERQSLAGERWQVIRDPETHFYADPVPWIEDGRSYLFFEDLDEKTQKGVISVVAFGDDGHPGAAKVCLEEEYHLSYPFMISHEGETYMIPETSANRDVALYKAANFPFGWHRHATLLEGLEAADVTLTRHEQRWWIFCVTREGEGGYSDCLSLFYADDLLGPWQPHAQNPVLIDVSAARPAGNMLRDGDRLFRPVQDCARSYGAGLKLFEVTCLTPQAFEQKEVFSLAPDAHWPGRKLHTLNRAGNLEVIDGAILRPRMSFLRALCERWFAPQGSEPDALVRSLPNPDWHL
ncbi:hypothetical protein SAMN04515647_2013 [Cohaesibacter sp. ES.047]|uniref:glucosamine inositolphosphorylceramide transferase family protein n=1 Tax=Cohaesibacter sp. ES.047 TaxID=1798205 RepID=UPI000BB6B51A|nr:hypothetical protein [Cohaesibacter sp. ES.047]SNY91771.1 hypothetical protein SAMN04515647_2013 [Cohaesibacter sp. ES.047]